MVKRIKNLSFKIIPLSYRQDSFITAALYKWLLVGILIRLFFMPITVYYPDLLGIYWRSSLIAYRKMFQIGGIQVFIHYFHALFLLIFKPLMPYFDTILNDPKMGMGCTWGMFTTFVSHPYVFRTLFLFKVPYFIFDLGCAFLFLKIFQDNEKGLRAFKFWILNPIVIFSTYIAARFECIIIFFVLLSLYYAKNNSFTKSLLYLGISIIIKFYSLIFLPFYVIIMGRKKKDYLKMIFYGLLPLVILISLNKLFYGTTNLEGLAATHHTSYFLTMNFHLYFHDTIFIFILIYAFFLLYVYSNVAHSFSNLWKTIFILMLTYYAFCFFHMHYLMWIIPFLTLQVADEKRFIKLFILQVLCVVVYAFQWKGNFAGWLFAPLSPSFFINLKYPSEIINQYYPADKFIGIFRSIFSGISLAMAYLVFRELSESRKEKKV